MNDDDPQFIWSKLSDEDLADMIGHMQAIKDHPAYRFMMESLYEERERMRDILTAEKDEVSMRQKQGGCQLIESLLSYRRDLLLMLIEEQKNRRENGRNANIAGHPVADIRPLNDRGL